MGNPFWNAADGVYGADPDDSGYLRRLIDTIKSRCNVDPRRIYLVGHSNGGSMAFRMACERAKTVSALVSFAGTFRLEADCRPRAPVHVLQIHGTDDDMVLYDGGSDDGGFYPGAIEALDAWAGYNRCPEPPEGIPDALDLDSSLPGEETSITRYLEGCRAGSSAELWTIEGGEHIPELSDRFNDLVVEHLLSCLGCSGKERLKKIKCNLDRRLLVKLRKGMGGDSYWLELSDGTVVEGRLNRRGKAKVKIKDMPSGEGRAAVFWECGATAERSYSCP
jgi:hypothetical protein